MESSKIRNVIVILLIKEYDMRDLRLEGSLFTMREATVMTSKTGIYGNMFWISPYGDVLGDTHPTHIEAVAADPEKFGLSQKYVEDTHARYGERIGSEGKAREDILLHLIGKGWMRVRNYGNRGWTINVNNFNDRIKDRITEFFQKLQAKDVYADVIIDHPRGVEHTTVDAIRSYQLFKEGVEVAREPLTWSESAQKYMREC